jgi:succinate dehydrogenase / fumarate reductase membrane anchor subunit
MSDLRTPLARARGLGSAKDGTHHWWVQRLTAVALVPLTIWFAASLVMLSGATYDQVGDWMERPLVMTFLILFVAVGMHHAQLGLQVVIEDYVHSEGLRIASVMLVKFIAVLAGLGGIIAVLKVGLGG